jgi:hypothetical protein
MLKQKSLRVTSQICRILHSHKLCYPHDIIQSLILEYFTSIYLQGRKDQIDKVVFKVGPEGIVTFPDKEFHQA